MTKPTLTIQGSDGALICDYVTGEILDRSGDPDGAYADVARFNPAHVSTPYDPAEFGTFDVLYMGHWTTAGEYETPAVFERDGKDGWEVYQPRMIGGSRQ